MLISIEQELLALENGGIALEAVYQIPIAMGEEEAPTREERQAQLEQLDKEFAASSAAAGADTGCVRRSSGSARHQRPE